MKVGYNPYVKALNYVVQGSFRTNTETLMNLELVVDTDNCCDSVGFELMCLYIECNLPLPLCLSFL